MTSIQPVRQINERVWQVVYEQELYMMKYYPHRASLEKVVTVCEQLQRHSFSHSLQVKKVLFDHYLLQPWISNSEMIHYEVVKDRTDTLHVLHELHRIGRMIQSSALLSLPTYDLTEKWERRLFRFQQMKKVCLQFLSEDEYRMIEGYAVDALASIASLGRIEEEQTILHGDVVHHNFLRNENGQVTVIDFDLAAKGPRYVELILWMHRVLPHISYHLDGLLEEQSTLGNMHRQHLMYLLYPNELLREWLYFLTLDEVEQRKNYAKIKAFTASALSHWPNLWYNILQINN